MPTTVKSIVDKAGRTIEMKSTPNYNNDAAFDSYMVLHENGCDNHTLTLVLKLHLQQITPATLNLPLVGNVPMPFQDFDKKWFVIKPWSAADFTPFTREFMRQCGYWNNKFWLTPPTGFTGLDYKVGGRTVRPNIYCHLHVELVAPGAAHRTFRLVNLDKPAAARMLGKPQNKLDASDFRSDSITFDSLDTKPVPLPFTDNKGKEHKLNRSTIAHEIGHALGLPHIGVPHSAPMCKLAMFTDSIFSDDVKKDPSYPALLLGGSNSQACYGSAGAANLGANVMGYGLEFDSTNATPWTERLALHTGTKATDWKVSVKKKLPPKFL